VFDQLVCCRRCSVCLWYCDRLDVPFPKIFAVIAFSGFRKVIGASQKITTHNSRPIGIEAMPAQPDRANHRGVGTCTSTILVENQRLLPAGSVQKKFLSSEDLLLRICLKFDAFTVLVLVRHCYLVTVFRKSLILCVLHTRLFFFLILCVLHTRLLFFLFHEHA
jgi:hypothetical protein